MTEKYTINHIDSFETLVEVSFTMKRNPPRVEECHGLHTFDEDEEMEREICSVKIEVKEGLWIDVTDRLTETERKIIMSNL